MGVEAISKNEKAKQRLLAMPRDYTYAEARALLGQLGFQEDNKGKTSGSRVKFYRATDKKAIMLHKPHPGDIVSIGNVKDLVEFLKGLGE